MSLTGRVATLDVESSMTIEDVKWIVFKKGPDPGVPPDIQALLLTVAVKSGELKDGLTLADCNIQDKSRLTLMLKLGRQVRVTANLVVGTCKGQHLL